MERVERFYRIGQLLQSRRHVPREVFLAELEVSPATFKRDLEYLRDRFHAPIVWDRALGGYRYKDGGNFHLPGIWFNESEVHALLIMEHLLEQLQPGLLTPHIEPLRTQIRALLEKGDHSYEEIQNRIRVLPLAARKMKLSAFESVCVGLLSRKRLSITHYSRQRGEWTEREISPQRLVHYRDNWYLDSWCHLRKGLRTFAVDTIKTARVLNSRARTVADKTLDEMFKAGYGIFSGKTTQTASLRFIPERARWVSREQWHPAQVSRFDEDGYYFLELPYSDERELLMDILKYGPDVEVLSPATLKNALKQRVKATLQQYSR